ncbi:MAG TPA: protein kinase [Vulgatibacter sp.]|nr:protein kinase [Vulgatibacter sp.]
MANQVCHRCGASFQGAACHLCGDTLLSHPVKDSLIGKVFAGRYKILRKLGQGGMGAVYLAEQVGIGHRVALKLLNQQLAGHEEIIQRFMNEAKSYARIAHPHAVAFHEFGQDAEGNLFISTEYIEGPDLKKYLMERGRLPPGDAFEVILQIADALEHAHQNGVIHRDLKPENVIVREGIRGIHAKVLDFGIARLLEEGQARLTVAGNIAGTPQYMSPEQVRGHDVDARADVYVIGVVLFELLTGLQPYAAPTVPEMLYRQAHDPVPPLTNFLPGMEAIDRVIQRATAKDPAARHPSMAAFAADLMEAMGELPPELASAARTPTSTLGVMSPPRGATAHGEGGRRSTELGTPAAAGMRSTDAAEGPSGTLMSAPAAGASPRAAGEGPGGTILQGARLKDAPPAKAAAGGTLPLADAATDTLLNEPAAEELGTSDTLVHTRAADLSPAPAAPAEDRSFDWEERSRGGLAPEAKKGRGRAVAAALVIFVGASAGATVGWKQGWFGGGAADAATPAAPVAPRDVAPPPPVPSGVEARPAAAERASEEEARSEKMRRQFLAKEIWLKANAEFLSGNLGTAGEILATVPEEESIAEDVATLRTQIDEVSKLLARGRAAARRGDCIAAIATFDRILSRYPGIREAASGRSECKRMLPPTLAE